MTRLRGVACALALLVGAGLVVVPPSHRARAQDGRRDDGGRKNGDGKKNGDRKDDRDGRKDGEGKGDGDAKKDDEQGADEEPREKTAEEKELEAIGKEFKDKDVDALMARVPADKGDGREGRVRVRLGKYDNRYGRTQAKGYIEEWLASRTILSVELKSTKDLVGTFEIQWRRAKEPRPVDATLEIRIARDGDGFVLKEIGVQAR